MNIKQTVLSGQLPQGLRILDAHAHLGDGEQPEKLYIRHLPPAEAIAESKRLGIGAMVASSHRSLYGHVVEGNDRMMEYTKEFPGYVYASLIYEPKNHEACMAQIEKYRRDPGFVGMKLHPPYTNTTLAGTDYDELCAYCAKEDILVACHTWQSKDSDPALFERILEKSPDLKLQLCHMGGTFRGCMTSVRLANQYPHVYLDINGSLFSRIWLEELVKEAPFEQFVFGTDQTYNDPNVMLGRVLLSDLSDEQKQQLLCDNFEKAIHRKLVL